MALDVPNILSKFTKAQRITALVLLLFTIVILSLGPTIISSLAPDNKELHVRIKQQKTEIDSLNQEVLKQGQAIVDLNRKIVLNQQECTNTLTQREQEILQMIADFKSGFKPQQQTVHYESYNTDENGEVVLKMEMPAPPDTKKDTYQALDKLEKQIKNKCK